MLSLVEGTSLTLTQGVRPSWLKTEKRFNDSIAKASPSRQIGKAESYVSNRIENRVLGQIAAGLMAALFGPVVLKQLDAPEWESTPVTNENIATITCILHLDGVELSDRARQTLATRLREARRPEDLPRYSMLRGLCGIYLGLPDIWQAETDIPWSDDYAFTPGRSFGGNVKGLMAYLGAATLRGASFEDVEPALLNFIREFDALREAGFVFFKHLVLVGIIAGHCIGDVPRAEALDWFGQYLCWAVGLREGKPASPNVDG